jgi:prevent-host-death family protein
MDHRSLAHAKARLSELVDGAEHHGKRTIILRHGKPAAAIVPVSVAQDSRPKPLTLLQLAKKSGDPTFDAVADLLEGRR